MKLRTVYQVRIDGRACAGWGETLDSDKARATLANAQAHFHRADRPVTLACMAREVFEIGDHVFYQQDDEAWCAKVIDICEDGMNLAAHVMTPEAAVVVCPASPAGGILPGEGHVRVRLATADEWRDSVSYAAQKRDIHLELG